MILFVTLQGPPYEVVLQLTLFVSFLTTCYAVDRCISTNCVIFHKFIFGLTRITELLKRFMEPDGNPEYY